MSTTHLISASTNPTPAIIPNPDLIGLVKRYLPGEVGIPVMYSIQGSVNFRIARLAGMLANAFASDLRATSGGVDGWNDCMSYLDEQQAAAEAFESYGLERANLIGAIDELVKFRTHVNDYFASLMGESQIPATDWASSLELAASPRPPEQFMLDIRWHTYVAQCKAQGEEPTMTKRQYDDISTIALTKERAAWAKHCSSVMTVLQVALDRAGEKDISFSMLDKKTQLSFLTKYGLLASDPMKVQDSILKSGRPPRNAFEFDATFRLRMAFYNACAQATGHHRYNEVRLDTPAVEPKSMKETSKTIAAANKVRNATPPEHQELIAESKKLAVATKPERKVRTRAKPKAEQQPLDSTKSLAEQPNDMP